MTISRNMLDFADFLFNVWSKQITEFDGVLQANHWSKQVHIKRDEVHTNDLTHTVQ